MKKVTLVIQHLLNTILSENSGFIVLYLTSFCSIAFNCWFLDTMFLQLANFDEIKQHQSADFCDYIHGFDQARLPLSSKRSFVLGYLFSTLSLMVVYSNLCSSHVVPTRNEVSI